MDTFKTLSALASLFGFLAICPSASMYVGEECYKFDSCRARYPFDGPSGGSASFAMAGNYDGVIDWNATAVMAPRDMDNTAFLKSMCQCDEECGLYRDCCRDASAAYGLPHDLDSSNSSQSIWSCQPLWKTNAKNDWKVAIYIVARCPDSFEDDESLVTMCERTVDPNSGGYSHLLDIPVLSRRTKRTYANVFCARCHGDSNELARWNFTYRCDQNLPRFNISMRDVLEATNYVPGNRRWTYRVKTISVNCELMIEQLKNVIEYSKTTHARRCIPNIGHCSPEWMYTNASRLCSSYSSYVIDPVTSQVYKNPYCALCNNLSENQTDYLCKRFTPFSGTFKGRFSFSGVFDFSFGWQLSASGDRVGIEQRCAATEIYDHLYNRCHAIICGAMYVNQGGICVPKRWTMHERNSSFEWLNSSCPRLNLRVGMDYLSLNNGSIVLNKTGQILRPKEYEHHPNETDAIQICFDESQQDYFFKYSTEQRYLSDICLSVSVVCLVFHILVHCAIPKLRNLPGKNLLSLSCALLLAQFLFLAVIDARESVGHALCLSLGALSHWSYLAAFFWMNIMGVDVSRTFVGPQILVRHNSDGRGQRSTYRFYSLYAWGLPTLIVSTGLLVDLAHLSERYGPNYGDHLCWICNKRGLAVFFIVPVASVLVANSILFTLTICSIIRQKKAAKFAVQGTETYREAVVTHRATSQSTAKLDAIRTSLVRKCYSTEAKHKQQIRFVLYLKLALIMGLGWISGFVAALTELTVLWYPFIIFNALQGAFIFATFTCKRKIYYMLYQRIMGRPHPLDRSSSTMNGRTRTTKMSTTSQPAVAVSQLLDQNDSLVVANVKVE